MKKQLSLRKIIIFCIGFGGTFFLLIQSALIMPDPKYTDELRSFVCLAVTFLIWGGAGYIYVRYRNKKILH